MNFNNCIHLCNYANGLPKWLSGKESACQSRRLGFHSWVGKIPWRRKWQLTPVFLPQETHGQRTVVGYSPWSCKETQLKQLSTYMVYLVHSFSFMFSINICLVIVISYVLYVSMSCYIEMSMFQQLCVLGMDKAYSYSCAKTSMIIVNKIYS